MNSLIKHFLVAALCITTSSQAQDAFSLLRTSAHLTPAEPQYKRVKIWFDGKPATDLARLGIDLGEGDFRKNVWFTSDLDQHTLARVTAAGFRTEILISDAKAFYKNRIESFSRRPELSNVQSATCGHSSPQYPAPSHFYYGSMGGFYTYDQLLSILDSMTLLYPNLISAKQPVDTTKTIEGRDIFYLKISDNPGTDEAEPEVLYTALHHAREPESLSQLIYYMWYLLENYNTDPEIQALVNNTEMYFIPCINPDGYIFNELTDPAGGGLWRKNRRDNLDGQFGVDLNRNYDMNWGYDDFGSSPSTIEDTYRGSSPFSEPETQAIRNFTNGRNFRLALNYHTYGNHMVTPWGHIPFLQTTDSLYFDFYGHAITKYNQYHVGTPYETVGYVTNGASDDWMYGDQSVRQKIFSMTPEVGDPGDGFWPDPSRIQFLSASNVFQNLTLAKLAGRYGTVSHHAPHYTGDILNQFHYTFRQLGLDTTGTFTISLTPVSANIIATGAPVTHSMLGVLQSVDDSISFTLDPGIQPGEEIIFTVKLDNGWYTEEDTVTQVFGNTIIALNDDGSDLSNWTTSGTWDATTEDFVSASSSISDSPFSFYQSNENNILELTNPVSLTAAIDAQLEFSAKWNIENDFDFLQILVSTDGGSSWTPLCGKYTNPGGTFQIPGEPLYDGVQEEWVQEEMSLNSFLGQNILIRFQLVSDNFSEFDGFYFDDLSISYINATGVGMPEPVAKNPVLSEPVPNPATGDATLKYSDAGKNAVLEVYNVFGQLVWKTTLDNTNGKVRIPAGKFASGLYSCFIRTSNGTVTESRKLVRE